MMQYIKALSTVYRMGSSKSDRTGVGTFSYPGINMRFDVSEAVFPILTTKKVNFKALVTELLWIIKGETNVKWLHENNCHIWDEWATAEKCERFGREEGDLGPTYGKQWRRFQIRDNLVVDQLDYLVEALKRNPFSRRILLSAWNPGEAHNVAVPPCLTSVQLVAYEGRNKGIVVDLCLYQRSGDMFLGVPFDISQYALLLVLLCKATGRKPGRLHHFIADAHIYKNHEEQVKKQLKRTPKGLLPSLELPEFLGGGGLDALMQMKPGDIKLNGYHPHPPIKAPVAV